MADTIRKLILQDLVGVLEAGDWTVYQGTTQLEYPDLPCAVLLPGMETADKAYGEQRLTLPVSIHAVQVVGDNEVGTLAEDTLGELISDVVGSRGDLERIDDIRYVSGGVETWPEQNEQALSVQIDIEIQYSTNIGDPYSQTTI